MIFLNESRNPKTGQRSSAAAPQKMSMEELHRQMERSLSGGQKKSSQPQQRKASSNKSVSQLSGRPAASTAVKKRTSKPAGKAASAPASDDKVEKMRRIKESISYMDSEPRSSRRTSAPSSTAAEAQRYVQRQSSPQRRRRQDDAYDYEIPRDYRQNINYQQQQAAADRKGRAGIIIVFAVIMLLIIAYVIGMLVCSNGFLPNTYMNGVDISGMTMDEAKEAVIHEGNVQGLTFIKKNGDEVHFNGEEFGSAVSLENDEAFEEAASRSAMLWFVSLFSKSEYETRLINTYDEDELAQLIGSYTWGTAPPTDAYLQKQSDGTYVVIPEDDGDMIDVDVLVEYALEQVRGGNTTIELNACDCYLTAEVTAVSLQSACEEANALMGLTITYDFEDRQEVLEASTIVEWVSSDADGNVTVDENAAKAWVQANLADKYDTYVAGYTRTFNSTLQGTIELPLGAQGIYGWKTDVSETTAALIELIKTGESCTVEPVYSQEGYCRGIDDIGDTYIEVDITNQHVWLYKDGQMVMDSDCVTGTQTNPDRATPTGVFQVWTKERDRNLEGEGYSAPVSYWMNVSWCGVGLHDLNRSAYGGDIYMYNGSHGCINLPPDFAADLFNAIEVGIPVLIIP